MTTYILAVNGLAKAHGFLAGLYGLLKVPFHPIASKLHAMGVTANQVTASRMVFPVLIYLFYNADTPTALWTAFLLFLLAAATDVIDGIIASEFEGKAKSSLGGLFDSLVDKVLIIAVYLLNLLRFSPLIIFTLVGEIIYAALAWLYISLTWMLGGNVKEAIEKVRSGINGKVKMTLEVVTAGLMMLSRTTGWETLYYLILVFGWAAFTFLILSFLGKVKTVLE